MSALDLTDRLSDLTEEITQIDEQTKLLTQKRTSALTQQDEETGKTIRGQLRDLQERREDLNIMKTAVESKLRVYKKNSQEAAEIRKRVAGELWPQGTKVLSKMQQALNDYSKALKEMDQLNGSMQNLAAEHERLIGETVNVPAISVPGNLRILATVRLPELPETLELKTRSQEVRETQERLEAAHNEYMTKQKALILPYLEFAEMTWPKCRTCGEDLVCIGGGVPDDRPEGSYEKPSYENKEAFRLLFRCEAGFHNGPEGFIRIERGPYEKVRLTPIDQEVRA